ncbi:MAG TPA: SDR family NAD(P)-dependent oxidoreductase [Candidatus Acidoferrales bacterium]|jgi:NADP-dependent 3-hydroxy acid dehydrogenase YdfG|nr:SDR family NAD(P)-dependent oxidoreductase [Candidatus Acidoferrales bacterium]
MHVGKPIESKVALVTGASRGIGLAIARSLAGLGAKVALCARDPEQLEKAAAALKDTGAVAAAIPADVRNANDVARLVRKAEQSLGPIEILVNNAGIGIFAPIHEASEADWDSVLDTNLKAVFLMTRAVAPGMIQRHSGHIINIGSLSGKSAFPGGAVYCASKWGLLGLTQCAAEDLRPHGVRVSAVLPGSVATAFSPHAGKDISKMLQPADVAHAVETIVTQAPQSFISEVLIRPAQKP